MGGGDRAGRPRPKSQPAQHPGRPQGPAGPRREGGGGVQAAAAHVLGGRGAGGKRAGSRHPPSRPACPRGRVGRALAAWPPPLRPGLRCTGQAPHHTRPSVGAHRPSGLLSSTHHDGGSSQFPPLRLEEEQRPASSTTLGAAVKAARAHCPASTGREEKSQTRKDQQRWEPRRTSRDAAARLRGAG